MRRHPFRVWGLASVLTILAACAAEPVPGKTVALSAAMPAVLDSQPGFSGTVLVVDNGEIAFSDLRGLADDAAGRALTLDDTWRWASVTKQIVAVLVLQEIEAGLLALDTPVDTLLPELTSGRFGDVTVKDLLQHTAGLANPSALDQDTFNTTFDWRPFCTPAPITPRERRFDYNNCDYLLLGEVIRAVSGASWQAQLEARILRPAGMTRTTVNGPQSVIGYDRAGTIEAYQNLDKFGPAGAITGDARDLAKFNTALMTGKLLSPASLELLWTGNPDVNNGALGAWSFRTALKGCPGPMHLVERHGYIGGIQVRNMIAPEINRSLIVFTNRGDLDFGQIWMATGLSYDLTSAAFCSQPGAVSP